MLISTQAAFAIRCPQCGKLETATVSRFACTRGRSVNVACSCGAHKLTVSDKRESVYLKVPCYLCDGVHFLYYTPRQFWRGDMQPIACADTDLQLGMFGAEREVTSYALAGGSELEQFLEDAAFGDYFDHPEAMVHALERVHTLAEEGKVRCRCGNRELSLDIFPEHLELNCPDCGRSRTLRAASEEDLTALDATDHIELGEDTPGRRKGHKK